MDIPNDEFVFDDALAHHALARRVGQRILKCQPPYVIGVCGSWGAGKTSFLHKLWAYLGGDFETPAVRRDDPQWQESQWRKARLDEIRADWFAEERHRFDQLLTKDRQLELIWFNPWQHQFEASPLVALLHEIRQHFTLKHRLLDEAGKLADVSVHALLNTLAATARELVIPSAKTITERGREYESERFATPLTSQRFRDLFECAISEITDRKGLLVIFIDDLDRCEGDTAYRLLESLKLYLNTRNCVYVLGLDQQHLETSIARALSGEKDAWRDRHIARDYLGKIFQNLFLLPVPRTAEKYVTQLVCPSDAELRREFEAQLAAQFGFTAADWPELVRVLDANLPHNPRKMKAFITSWRLHLDALPELPAGAEKLDWRLSLVLHYLAQFEEPLFRKVEEAPQFYNDHLAGFCQTGVRSHYLLDDRLELPFEWQQELKTKTSAPPSASETGAYSTAPPGEASAGAATSAAETKPPNSPRVLWISRLINELAREYGVKLPPELILRHLLHTGGAA